ncbi:MAG TPA: phenylacetate-CoA oxygenase/reductase subunit PaaK [Panacibacter sp.]|nr:phenylacetate-CoA oxygenase/reductase subunit PaaK [Panacibacter sp.]HNP42965.1 phenylacetate-CoA oxygenase/reductase subunit PaaK [Panacibacter sp.]
MSVHFEKVRVKSVDKETADAVSVLFEIPESLKEKFSYIQGQHLTIRTFIDEEEVRRSYSLCSSPLDDEWRVAIKKVKDGIFSTYANEQLKAGDELEIMPPMGHFNTSLFSANKKNYTAIVAGSGITPVLSIIKTTLATEPGSSFILIFGNRNRASIMFREELEAIKNKYLDRFTLIHTLSREITDAEINHGRIDALKCASLFNKVAPLNSDEFFICGPEQMIFTVKDFLLKNAVPEEKIHIELFNTTGLQRQNTKKEIAENIGRTKSDVTVKLDGITFNFDVDFYGRAILDEALKSGADLPYSCKGGVCCTCKALLLEGEVKMDVHYGLEQEEIEQGYILACQSHPVTEKVVIDFDIK